MVLLNAAKAARYVGTTVHQDTGGGSKKAGFPYQVGRDTWTSIYFSERAQFDLKFWRTLPRGYPAGGPRMNMPIGFDTRLPMR